MLMITSKSDYNLALVELQEYFEKIYGTKEFVLQIGSYWPDHKQRWCFKVKRISVNAETTPFVEQETRLTPQAEKEEVDAIIKEGFENPLNDEEATNLLSKILNKFEIPDADARAKEMIGQRSNKIDEIGDKND